VKARQLANLPASIHQRLLARAKQEGRPLQELLQYYAIERFLFRLGQSPYADKFFLKGAMMLRVWESQIARPTMDVDLMGRVAASEERLSAIIKEICSQDCPDDGVEFDSKTLHAEVIRVDAEYQGIRVRFVAFIGKMRVPMQVDVGFGDKIIPAPMWIHFPTLLDFPPPHLLAYPPEATLAEKFQAIVTLDIANSRMKDFYDIWTLARRKDFDGRLLSQSIAATFERRKTSLPTDAPTGLTKAFAEDRAKRMQWDAFLRKGRMDGQGMSLEDVVAFLRDFLLPPTIAAAAGKPFDMQWPAGGPWQASPDKKRR